jgi:hypothetical protein
MTKCVKAIDVEAGDEFVQSTSAFLVLEKVVNKNSVRLTVLETSSRNSKIVEINYSHDTIFCWYGRPYGSFFRKCKVKKCVLG